MYAAYVPGTHLHGSSSVSRCKTWNVMFREFFLLYYGLTDINSLFDTVVPGNPDYQEYSLFKVVNML